MYVYIYVCAYIYRCVFFFFEVVCLYVALTILERDLFASAF